MTSQTVGAAVEAESGESAQWPASSAEPGHDDTKPLLAAVRQAVATLKPFDWQRAAADIAGAALEAYAAEASPAIGCRGSEAGASQTIDVATDFCSCVERARTTKLIRGWRGQFWFADIVPEVPPRLLEAPKERVLCELDKEIAKIAGVLLQQACDTLRGKPKKRHEPGALAKAMKDQFAARGLTEADVREYMHAAQVRVSLRAELDQVTVRLAIARRQQESICVMIAGLEAEQQDLTRGFERDTADY